jgi:hypothetical protein
MLGPPVCIACEIIADYHPNEENSDRQGDWLCPICGFDCNGSLFLYSKDDQELISFHSTIFNENKGQALPD